jgi:hypothetical protein
MVASGHTSDTIGRHPCLKPRLKGTIPQPHRCHPGAGRGPSPTPPTAAMAPPALVVRGGCAAPHHEGCERTAGRNPRHSRSSHSPHGEVRSAAEPRTTRAGGMMPAKTYPRPASIPHTPSHLSRTGGLQRPDAGGAGHARVAARMGPAVRAGGVSKNRRPETVSVSTKHTPRRRSRLGAPLTRTTGGARAGRRIGAGGRVACYLPDNGKSVIPT